MIFRRKSRRWLSRWDVTQGNSLSLWQRISPPQMFVGSFLLLIFLGTLGFKFLPGLYTGPELSWRDALFTSTSAVCVTGLIVVDTSDFFTPVGQGFILALIQLGGLGMLAFTSLIIALLGRRLSLRAESLAVETRKAGPQVDVRRLTLDVVRFTFAIEMIGALLLYFTWGPKLGWREAIWPAIFHSVSAFCNAGFSTFESSLVSWNDSPMTLGIIMMLIVAGGMGFVTMEEVYLRFFTEKKRRIRRLSIHSRLVLFTTIILLFGAWPLFAIFEWNETFEGMSVVDKLSNSLFLSTTARTAGFNAVEYADATDSTNFLTILLMTVGGSPGSTAGGMKTTTFALVFLLAWSRFRSHETTTFGNRSIPEDTIQRAVGVSVLSFVVIAIGVFALATTEQYARSDSSFLSRMFEAVSAFNTVGLSMDENRSMSGGGRWVTIGLMILGRVGPLTMAAALIVRRSRKSNFRYAYEDVVVG